MSEYEFADVAIASLALTISVLVPFVQFLRRKLSKPKLRILPFDYQEMTLQFNPHLSWFGLRFSIQCERAECVVSSIEAEVTRKEDGCKILRRWTILEPIWTNWANLNGDAASLNSFSHARPIRLKKDSLEPLIVSFTDDPTSKSVIFSKELDSLIGRAREQRCSSTTLGHNASEIRHPDEYASLKTALEDKFFWIRGSYSIAIKVNYDAGKSIIETFYFSVSEDEEAQLRNNIEHLASNLVNSGPYQNYISVPICLFK